MNFSPIILGLENITEKNIRQLNFDLENYKLSEIEAKEFLIRFFRKDIEKSLFVSQIFELGEKAVFDFQEHIFNYTINYFKELINIDGISFSYDKNIFPLTIDISLAEMILCKIHIFSKQIEILENYYFKDVHETISNLNKEKEILLDEYSKLQKYESNTMELLKDDSNLNALKSLDIIVSSMRKNKNKYKAEIQQQCFLIETRVAQIDLEVEECLLIESSIKKSMLSINYYQNKISDRLSRNLKYTIYKN